METHGELQRLYFDQNLDEDPANPPGRPFNLTNDPADWPRFRTVQEREQHIIDYLTGLYYQEYYNVDSPNVPLRPPEEGGASGSAGRDRPEDKQFLHPGQKREHWPANEPGSPPSSPDQSKGLSDEEIDRIAAETRVDELVWGIEVALNQTLPPNIVLSTIMNRLTESDYRTIIERISARNVVNLEELFGLIEERCPLPPDSNQKRELPQILQNVPSRPFLLGLVLRFKHSEQRNLIRDLMREFRRSSQNVVQLLLERLQHRPRIHATLDLNRSPPTEVGGSSHSPNRSAHHVPRRTDEMINSHTSDQGLPIAALIEMIDLNLRDDLHENVILHSMLSRLPDHFVRTITEQLPAGRANLNRLVFLIGRSLPFRRELQHVHRRVIPRPLRNIPQSALLLAIILRYPQVQQRELLAQFLRSFRISSQLVVDQILEAFEAAPAATRQVPAARAPAVTTPHGGAGHGGPQDQQPPPEEGGVSDGEGELSPPGGGTVEFQEQVQVAREPEDEAQELFNNIVAMGGNAEPLQDDDDIDEWFEEMQEVFEGLQADREDAIRSMEMEEVDLQDGAPPHPAASICSIHGTSPHPAAGEQDGAPPHPAASICSIDGTSPHPAAGELSAPLTLGAMTAASSSSRPLAVSPTIYSYNVGERKIRGPPPPHHIRICLVGELNDNFVPFRGDIIITHPSSSARGHPSFQPYGPMRNQGCLKVWDGFNTNTLRTHIQFGDMLLRVGMYLEYYGRKDDPGAGTAEAEGVISYSPYYRLDLYSSRFGVEPKYRFLGYQHPLRRVDERTTSFTMECPGKNLDIGASCKPGTFRPGVGDIIIKPEAWVENFDHKKNLRRSMVKWFKTRPFDKAAIGPVDQSTKIIDGTLLVRPFVDRMVPAAGQAMDYGKWGFVELYKFENDTAGWTYWGRDQLILDKPVGREPLPGRQVGNPYLPLLYTADPGPIYDNPNAPTSPYLVHNYK